MPLITGLVLLFLVTTGVASDPWLWALPFLIAFVGGTFADALETGQRRAFTVAAVIAVIAQAALCIASLYVATKSTLPG